MTLTRRTQGAGWRHSDSVARPNNVNITSCSVWRHHKVWDSAPFRTSLWASAVPWPWAWLDNTALDNGVCESQENACWLLSADINDDKLETRKQTKLLMKTYSDLNSSTSYFYFYIHLAAAAAEKKKPKAKLGVQRNTILQWVTWPLLKNTWPRYELRTRCRHNKQRLVWKVRLS